MRGARSWLLTSALLALALASGCLRLHAHLPGTLRADLDDEQVIVRDSIDVEHTRFYLLWGLLPLSDDDELTLAAREQALAAGGDGLANLVFEARFTPVDYVLQVLTLGVLMPRTYRLRADVVRIDAPPLPGHPSPGAPRGGEP